MNLYFKKKSMLEPNLKTRSFYEDNNLVFYIIVLKVPKKGMKYAPNY